MANKLMTLITLGLLAILALGCGPSPAQQALDQGIVEYNKGNLDQAIADYNKLDFGKFHRCRTSSS